MWAPLLVYRTSLESSRSRNDDVCNPVLLKSILRSTGVQEIFIDVSQISSHHQLRVVNLNSANSMHVKISENSKSSWIPQIASHMDSEEWEMTGTVYSQKCMLTVEWLGISETISSFHLRNTSLYWFLTTDCILVMSDTDRDLLVHRISTCRSKARYEL